MPIMVGSYVCLTGPAGTPVGQVGIVCAEFEVSCCVHFPAGCMRAFKQSLVEVPAPAEHPPVCSAECSAGEC